LLYGRQDAVQPWPELRKRKRRHWLARIVEIWLRVTLAIVRNITIPQFLPELQ
jgi:hypothetical protein